VRALAQPAEDLTPEQLHRLRVAEAVCAEAMSAETCAEARPPNNWRCTWSKSGDGDKGACVPSDPCEWTPNPIVNENIGVVWLLSVAGAFECILKLLSGCSFSIGSCVWCFMAFSLCTCCWCLPFPGVHGPCLNLCSKLRQSWPSAGVFTPSASDLVVDDGRPGVDWRPLGSFVSQAALRSLEVQCGWWGTPTGRVRVSLRREGQAICTEDVFGACAWRTRSGSVASRRFALGDELVSRALAGDELVFEYCTGLGQGGALRIQHFEANPLYEEPV
jgi:hypothetical protein